ncbi:hypothetical protein J437_LFUL004242 [Ladona fulva]|uniref:Uncharacterized protein n=1 Tax=Ladona fulva TaxID=123851 RepID=A0A8K0JZ98_LADFU|nr:hypothetical protein J437_LFUL004242 [Ladona fulva]
MEHLVYGPDLALSDYHLFDPLNDALKGRLKFTSDQQVKGAVHMWLAAQPKTFYPRVSSSCVQGRKEYAICLVREIYRFSFPLSDIKCHNLLVDLLEVLRPYKRKVA